MRDGGEILRARCHLRWPAGRAFVRLSEGGDAGVLPGAALGGGEDAGGAGMSGCRKAAEAARMLVRAAFLADMRARRRAREKR